MVKLLEESLVCQGKSLIRSQLSDTNQGGAIVRRMASGPLRLRPWPEHTPKTLLSLSPMVCPFHCTHADHVQIGWGLYLLGVARDLDSSVLPRGISLPSNLLAVGTSSNAIATVSKGAYSLSGMIKSGPTYTSETRR